MAETCLFSKAQGGTTPLIMVFDSRYAANATQGKQKKAESNLELAAVCNKLYVEEKKRRDVQLIWVRGHSGNKGNDRADLLAQWGKASGPHFTLTESFLRNRARFPGAVSCKFPPPKRVRFPAKSAIFQRNGSSFRR